MKDNKITAKVNKEIGGWDYRGYHIDRDKEAKVLTVFYNGDELVAKTLGEAKAIIDDIIDYNTNTTKEMDFVSKRGTAYKVQKVNGAIKAFTYNENGSKTYWSVTKEIERFFAELA